MKNFFKGGLCTIAVAAVFAVSFLAGRMTTLKSNRDETEKILDEAQRAVAVLPLLRASESEEKEEILSTDETFAVNRPNVEAKSAPEDEAEQIEEPPFPLLKPVDGAVSQDYSITAIYSETMRDWRAHCGIDIEAPLTSEVKAAADGTVSRLYEDKLWGNVLEITHKGGLKSVYKGVSTLSMVSMGEDVKKGDVISGVGMSPCESKAMAHLHFEIYQDETNINPCSYVID